MSDFAAPCNTPGLHVPHYLPESAWVHVHWSRGYTDENVDNHLGYLLCILLQITVNLPGTSPEQNSYSAGTSPFPPGASTRCRFWVKTVSSASHRSFPRPRFPSYHPASVGRYSVLSLPVGWVIPQKKHRHSLVWFQLLSPVAFLLTRHPHSRSLNKLESPLFHECQVSFLPHRNFYCPHKIRDTNGLRSGVAVGSAGTRKFVSTDIAI